MASTMSTTISTSIFPTSTSISLSKPQADRSRRRSAIPKGPTNLPDGPYRRRVQKTKRVLVERAKTARAYAKIRRRELDILSAVPVISTSTSTTAGTTAASSSWPQPASMELHSSRQAMLGRAASLADTDDATDLTHRNSRPVDAAATGDAGTLPEHHEVSETKKRSRRSSRKPKTVPFAREAREAAQRQEEREMRRLEIENMKRERERKLEEREKFRRAMAKARKGGKNGQRKLGRESAVLLEKVRKMVEENQHGRMM